MPFCRGGHRRGKRPGAGTTDARHSLLRLPAKETSPQPRPLRTPLVAQHPLSPVWSDGVKRRERHRRERLQRRSLRAGRLTPGFREETPMLTDPRCLLSHKRSQASGAFLPPAKADEQCGQCLFHQPEKRAGDARAQPVMARRIDGEKRINHRSAEPPQHPSVTSAFE